jgi:glycosyltransferase involved in cell wall biosynthesis
VATTLTAPTISVLVPVHNAEKYIRAAVESALSQTFEDFELLVLDDGSTDSSLSILRELEVKDTRVRVFSRENRGVTPTRNELVSLARGLYLANLDADDVSRPQRFEKQVAYLTAHPDCVALGTGVLFIDPEGMPLLQVQYEITHSDIDLAHLCGTAGSRMCNSSVMMRKAAVLKVGSYFAEYRFAEDLDLFLRLAEIGKLANLSEVLLEYRRHHDSIGYAHRAEELAFARQAVQAAWIRRGLPIGPEVMQSNTEPETTADVHRKWAWWALAAGNPSTARKHAIKALVAQPFNVENIRAVVCAIRGH